MRRGRSGRTRDLRGDVRPTAADPPGAGQRFLSRTVCTRRPAFATALGALLALGLWLRVDDLARKPLHHDEGVNGWLTLQLYWWNLYRYDPTDYHGPLLFYANLPFFHLLGPGETALRMASVLAGALLPLALLPARRLAGDAAVLAAGLMLAVGPGFVYFSRTAIHEIHLVLWSALWAVALARFAESPRRRWAMLAAAAAALAFATKETALLTAASLASGAGLAWLLGRPREAGADGGADLFGARTRGEALRAWVAGSRRAGWLGAAVFAVLVVVLFSSFFGHARGVVDFFSAYGPWADYGLSGRNQAKAFGYYWGVMASTEGAWRWLAPAAALLAAATRDRLGLALAGWAGVALLVYSALPYKTPWCVLEIDLPALLLVAWAIGRLARAARARERRPALRAAAALAALACLAPAPGLVAQSLEDNRERFDDFRRPYVYYQTVEEFSDMLRDFFTAWELVPGADGGGPRVLNVDLEFPLGFYTLTRGWAHGRTRYVDRAPSPDEPGALDGIDLIVSHNRQLEAIEALLAARGGSWHRERYYHRPGIYAYAWYREPLWERYQAAGGREIAAPWPRPPLRPLPAPPCC